MRYVIFFNQDNLNQGVRFYKGKKLNPDEEVKKIKHPNWKRFSEEMIKSLTGEENWDKKKVYIDLDDKGKPFFNEYRYKEETDDIDT